MNFLLSHPTHTRQILAPEKQKLRKSNREMCASLSEIDPSEANISLHFAFLILLRFILHTFLLCLFYEVIAKHFFVVFILFAVQIAIMHTIGCADILSFLPICFFFRSLLWLSIERNIKAFSSRIVINPKWLLEYSMFSFYLENCNAKKDFFCFAVLRSAAKEAKKDRQRVFWQRICFSFLSALSQVTCFPVFSEKQRH